MMQDNAQTNRTLKSQPEMLEKQHEHLNDNNYYNVLPQEIVVEIIDQIIVNDISFLMKGIDLSRFPFESKA